ncbi:MAG TPA: hypothetical protein VGX78_03405 [Pirellulales bacterium]|jgi:hypothetical protein|nr:hypothetical protein [Pirellulales bacterium]
MANVLAQPNRPVENWESQLNAWLADIEGVFQNAERWAARLQWTTKRDSKVITEQSIGQYEAPLLLIHAPQGRLMLDPIARFVGGAEGRIDFCVMPSFDSAMLVKVDGGWRFSSNSRTDFDLPWSEESFATVAAEMLKSQ